MTPHIKALIYGLNVVLGALGFFHLLFNIELMNFVNFMFFSIYTGVSFVCFIDVKGL